MPTRIRFEKQEISIELLKKFSLFSDNDLVTVNFLKNERVKDSKNCNSRSSFVPVLYKGKLKLFPWKGFCRLEFLKAGKLENLKPKLVKILVCQAYTKGVWYQVKEGIHGILVWEDRRFLKKLPECYFLTAPATHYFKTMTGAERMPVLINQKI